MGAVGVPYEVVDGVHVGGDFADGGLEGGWFPGLYVGVTASAVEFASGGVPGDTEDGTGVGWPGLKGIEA